MSTKKYENTPSAGRLHVCALERVEVALPLRGITDDIWHSTIRYRAEDLMQSFPLDGSVGLNAEIIKEALLADMDPTLLSDTIAREFVSRLRRGITTHAGLDLDLRYRTIETVKLRPIRVVRMTAAAEDVGSIYAWNVARMNPSDGPKASVAFNHWDWGRCLDSIVRHSFPSSVYAYSNILGEISNDGFVVKAMLMALRSLDRYHREAVGSRFRH